MTLRNFVRLGTVLAILLVGVTLLSAATAVGRDTSLRQEALYGAMAPAGVNTRAGTNAAPADMGPISAVTVNLADVPEGEYVANNQYDLWMRGEIDLEDMAEGRVPEAEVLALREKAMGMAPSANVQDADSATGNAPDPAGVAFDSLDMNDCCGGGGVTPPDPEMAAGPDNLIAVVNLSFEIYDKSGNSLAGPTTFSSFFAPLGGACSSGPFDPNVVYDEEADRWALAADGSGTHYCIGVSQTSDPTGAYNLYAVPATPWGGEFHDYPHTGVGDNYIVVGANQFGGAIPGGFEGRVWALDKADMYAGDPLTPFSFSTTIDYGTPQPLNLHGYDQGTWPALGDTHYFVTDLYDGCTQQVWEWNIPAAPTIAASIDLCAETGVTGGFPLDTPQMGGGTVQGNDWRMRGFEYRNGYGWVTDSISCNPGGGSVNCVRWDQIDLMAGTPTVEQAGVYSSAGTHRIFPDLAVNHCDDMAIGFTKSSSSMYPGTWYTGRESGDPAGSLQAEAELKAGEVAYVGFDGAPYRWGDYTGMTIDPDGETFWYLGEYSKDISASANWGNYIGSFVYPDCDAGGGGGEPEIEVDPMFMSSTQNTNTVVNQTLTISNTGTANLDWDIFEDESAAPVSSPERLGPPAPANHGDSRITPTADVIQDGGFEAGTPNPFWNEFSTNFGTPLCDAVCGTGGGTGPHSGSWWAWFGGITGVSETGSVDQDVVIPVGTAVLSFWLEIPVADTTGFMNVEIDNNVLATYTEADQGAYATYQLVAIDVSAYADGGSHNVEFYSTTDAGAGPLNFFVDDVVLDSEAQQDCDAVDDIPWLSVSPDNGTTAPGGATGVTVTFDSTGMAAGTYTGNLCINSNDADEPLTVVPVEMIVEQPTDVGLSGIGGGSSVALLPVMLVSLLLAVAGLGLLLRRRSVANQ